MAQVGLTLDFSGYTGKLLVVWKKASAPLAEVGRSSAFTFPVSTTITAPNLTDESYIFEFWQSTDGVALTTLLRVWSIDASAYSGGIAVSYTYVVDRGNSGTAPNWADPADGATSITDQRISGAAQSDLRVDRRGMGPMRDDEYSVLAGGGIQLLVPGDQFNHDGTITVTWFKKISSTSSSVAESFTDLVNITANTTYSSATHKNKLLNCTSTATTTTFTFPAFGSMADQKLKFSTQGMLIGGTLILQFALGNTVPFQGVSRNVIYLGKAQELEILIRSGVAYILDGGSTAVAYIRRGRREFVNQAGLNQLALDGTEYNVSAYPAFVEWLNGLPAGQVLSSRAAWNTTTNMHFFYLDTGTSKFGVPDDRGIVYKATKVGEVPGRYEADQILAHSHDLKSTNSGASGNTLADPVRGSLAGSVNTANSVQPTGAAENTVRNAGQVAVINI